MNKVGGWFYTSLYGHTETQWCYTTWELLKSLWVNGDEAWLVGGDLNKIMDTTKKWKGVVGTSVKLPHLAIVLLAFLPTMTNYTPLLGVNLDNGNGLGNVRLTARVGFGSGRIV